MKLTELINKVDTLRANQIPDDVKRGWLSDIELMLIDETILTHELPQWVAENETYQKYAEKSIRGPIFDENTDVELIVPAPYDDLYYWWLVSKIDLIEGNTERYENDFRLYNNACLTYKDWYNRTYMPARRTGSFMRGGARSVSTTTKADK